MSKTNHENNQTNHSKSHTNGIDSPTRSIGEKSRWAGAGDVEARRSLMYDGSDTDDLQI
ncbi:hypothetical protein P692DRAFT_20836390 [Suillus brevipes Sb2]|nr:hypothetical protein P692DRAFT_20836390 [Suillus brevipes Sb2]